MPKKEEPTHQPRRVVIGHCPECLEVCVVFNNHEAWPVVKCKCGWGGATTSLENRARYEWRGMYFLPKRRHPEDNG